MTPSREGSRSRGWLRSSAVLLPCPERRAVSVMPDHYPWPASSALPPASSFLGSRNGLSREESQAAAPFCGIRGRDAPLQELERGDRVIVQ